LNSINPQKYLKIPIIRERLRFETSDLEESIREFIGLIINTRPGNFRYDKEFGCHIWDQEFQIIKRGRFKEDVQKAVQEGIEKFEPRLKTLKVEISVRGFEEVSQERKVVEIWVRGVVRATERTFEENYEIDWDRGRRSSSRE
jgi:phage baseplate assembly protein W